MEINYKELAVAIGFEIKEKAGLKPKDMLLLY